MVGSGERFMGESGVELLVYPAVLARVTGGAGMRAEDRGDNGSAACPADGADVGVHTRGGTGMRVGDGVHDLR